MADWEDAPKGNDGWEDAGSKPLKIGAEGFSDAMRSTMKSKSWIERNAAAVGNFPTQMYQGAKQRLGFEDPIAIRAGRVIDEEAPVGATAGAVGTLSLASLVPGANSFLGQVGLGGATGLLTPTEGDESSVTNALLGSAIAGPSWLAMKGLGTAANKWLQGSKADAAATASQQAQRTKTIEAGLAEGMVLPPTVLGGGSASKAMEAVGGRADVARDASIKNVEVANKIARREASLAPDEAITEGALKKARDVLAHPYKEIAGISPRAAEALEKLKDARLDAKDYWVKYAKESSPEIRKQAIAADNKVATLERVIDKEAKAVGRADLLPALDQARVAIAKNYNVEAALNLGSGSIDPRAIGRAYDKVGEKGMTGGLATVGKFAQTFPDFVNPKAANQSASGVSKLTYLSSLAAGGAGYGASEHYGGSPYGVMAAAVPMLASGPARSVALSRFMQGAPTYGPGSSVRLADLATNHPMLRTAPGAAVLAEQER